MRERVKERDERGMKGRGRREEREKKTKGKGRVKEREEGEGGRRKGGRKGERQKIKERVLGLTLHSYYLCQ